MISGPLRYLIGADAATVVAVSGHVTEIPYDAARAIAAPSILYGNLLDEEYARHHRYPPYLKQGETAHEWNEGQIDPAGAGWLRNLDDQIAKARRLNATALELDNADSYHLDEVTEAYDYVHAAGVDVVAKNPLLVEGDHVALLSHPAVVGVVVEADCGTCDGMQSLRRLAGKPTLPVWFVSNKREKAWAGRRAATINYRGYVEMGVTWCPATDDYSQCVDILVPRP